MFLVILGKKKREILKTFFSEIHAYFFKYKGKNDRNAVCKVSKCFIFFLVFRQKSRNFYGIKSRIREREGGESSHRQPRTKGILTIRRCGRQGDSIGPCETFDSSRKRKHFHTITFYLMCATVHSHVTCTPVETIIGRT